MTNRLQKNGRNRAQTRRAQSSPTVDRQTIIDGLNHDLAGEYQAILMYTHYSAKLTGPFRKELRALFQAEIADEHRHAQVLADKIAVLGGEPTTEPRPVMEATSAREMVEQALAAGKEAVANYEERVCQAEAFGDVGLKVDLENQVGTKRGTRKKWSEFSRDGSRKD